MPRSLSLSRRGGGARSASAVRRGAGGGVFFEVGQTPTWAGQLAEWKHEQRLLVLSGLAASAAAAGLVAAGRGSGGGAGGGG